MYQIIQVFKMPDDGILRTFKSEQTTNVKIWEKVLPGAHTAETDVYESAVHTVDFLNNNVVRQLTDGTIGFVIYNTATPLYNIAGTNAYGNQVKFNDSGTDKSAIAEGVPFEAARLLCRYWNNNHVPNIDKWTDHNTVQRFSYFLPISTLEV